MPSAKIRAGAVMAAAVLGAADGAAAESLAIVVGGESYRVELASHSASASLLAMLPITVKFEDYGAVERIAYLPKRLDTSGAPTSTKPRTGDLTYYAPWGNLAVFTGPFRKSEGLVPLGTLPPEALRAVKKSGDAEVTLTRAP